jgi:TolA-binding protein
MGFLEEYPESRLVPQATFMIGDSYYNLGQYDSAFAWYHRVLEQHPSSTVVPEAIDAVRFSLDAMGRGIEAIAVIDTFMIRNPNRLPADSLTWRKAMILFDQGAYDEATALLIRFESDFPESALLPDVALQTGLSFEYSGRRDSALIFLERTVALHPTSVAAERALIEQGNIRLRMHDPGAASSNFNLFLERFPESPRLPEARFGLAQTLLTLRDTAGALRQYRAIVDSASTGEEDILIDRSRLAMARIFADEDSLDAALEILASIVARRLDDIAAEALLLRSELLIDVNDLAGALAEIRRLTGDFAEYTDYSEPGLLLLGELYEKLTNYDAARETYSQLAVQTQNDELRSMAEARIRRLRR